MTKFLRLATIIILSIIVCISKASASSLDEFVSARAQAIKQNWLPPKGNEGYSVAVNFRVHRDGSVSDFQVVQQHNRIQIVVDAARAAIINAAPRPLPAGAPESILIQAHFRYDFSNTSPWLFLIDEEKHTAALILTEDQKVAMKTSSEQIAGLQPYMAEVAARCKRFGCMNRFRKKAKPSISGFSQAEKLTHTTAVILAACQSIGLVRLRTLMPSRFRRYRLVTQRQ